jgi:hypothetical protein
MDRGEELDHFDPISTSGQNDQKLNQSTKARSITQKR